jgi:phosphoribosylformimino-5-aminoimidazole carboxamide ribotide isomerase
MDIYPAIDLKNGRCVRLRQGRADAATVYADDPVAMARRWADAGARWLHVVDLDGAFAGRPMHRETIARMAAAVRIPIQCGGGLRSDAHIRELLEAGAARIVLGTRACERPDELAALAARFGDRLAVGLDAREGRVQVKGWVETTATQAVDLAAAVASAGIRTLVYTDTAVDGTLAGPDLEGTRAVCAAASCAVIASGGVASAGDVRRLAGLQQPNLAGVIVGKALYEGRVTLEDLIRAAAG